MPEEDIIYFPERYTENYLYLLDVDPTHVHVMWGLAPESIPEPILNASASNPRLCLKIHCDLTDNPGSHPDVSFAFQVYGLINDWFVTLERPTKRCIAELGYYDPQDGIFITLCRSNELEIMPDQGISLEAVKKRALTDEQETDEGKHPSSSEEKGEEGPSPAKAAVTEEEIKEYYRLLPERVVNNTLFPPWRMLLDRILSEEIRRTIHLSELIDIFGQMDPLLQTHASDRPAPSSSSSSMFSADQDR